MMKKIYLVFLFSIISVVIVSAESGYDLWLRYPKVDNTSLLKTYRKLHQEVVFEANSVQLNAAKEELLTGLKGLLDIDVKEVNNISRVGIVVGTPASSTIINKCSKVEEVLNLDDEGFIIYSERNGGKRLMYIAGKTDIGVLYGVFRYLQLIQTQQLLDDVYIVEAPRLKHRVLNHWDNLNGRIERGYAGYTIWEWQRLPGYVSPRYKDYARANASVGINGTVLNNVNANSSSLKEEYLIKTAAIADVLRPYGIKVYLTARFSAPREIGGLSTADPLDPRVRAWWEKKVEQIYKYIPDFGGFLVKANSEGQPGPQDYKRTHADGANMMAEMLKPYGGIVMWRAFVYHNSRNVDRALNGYEEFMPLDGMFNDNVFVQPKNGPIDFQPREPFHPLFGAMPSTPLMLEFQITQEYLGYATHLAYLGTLFEETLDSDTYSDGEGSTVGRVLESYNDGLGMSGMAGVSNIGSDINWTGHLFGQSNWYSFGRLCWNYELSAEDIAEEWIRMTLSNKSNVVDGVKAIMMDSREAVVNYTGPLGLNHIMDFATHYGPGPWYKDPNWDARDYHKADKNGLGVDRTTKGSDAVSQYHTPIKEKFNSIETCPPEFLLWFHHVSWDYELPSGRILWDELVHYYHRGVDQVREMQKIWASLDGFIDVDRFRHVEQLLKVQEDEAIWWRDGCLLYFQEYSGKQIPEGYEKPAHSLNYYKRMPFPYNWEEFKFN